MPSDANTDVPADARAGETTSAAGNMRIAVLASGTGSNLQALLDFERQPFAKYRVVVVGTNRSDAKALERAAQQGKPTFCESHRNHASRESFEAALVDHLTPFRPDWIVLAGFMRVLSGAFVTSFTKRIVNVHPALCPAYPGLHAARQALAAGARVTGCTVHLVDCGVDTGPILAQAAVPVLDGDDEASLQRRIQHQEHRLLPAVLQAIACGHLQEKDGGFRLLGLAPENDGLAWRLGDSNT